MLISHVQKYVLISTTTTTQKASGFYIVIRNTFKHILVILTYSSRISRVEGLYNARPSGQMIRVFISGLNL